MADVIDFPPAPAIGDQYTGSSGVVYQWNGVAWVVGFYDPTVGILPFSALGDVIGQVRTLLQDTDISSGEYRYSSNSLVTNVNQGMLEMYRIRPDIFLELGFKVPSFSSADMTALLQIEPQFVPALVYYVTGLAQLRDDEPTQDQRASAFLAKFTSMLVSAA